MIALALATAAWAGSCLGTCVAPAQGEELPLAPDEIPLLVDALPDTPPDGASPQLDLLLFHDDQVREWLDGASRRQRSAVPDWLVAELSRTEVGVVFRLVGADGALLGEGTAELNVRKKAHVLLESTGALGLVDVNGRVRRVGADHLWARF